MDDESPPITEGKQSSASQTNSTNSPGWREHIAGGLIYTAPPAFSKDGDFLIACTATVLKVYSTQTGEIVKSLRHKSHVTGFFFNPANALQLYSTSYDGTIRLWDFEDGVLLKSWRIGGGAKIKQAVLEANNQLIYLSIEKHQDGGHSYLIGTFSLRDYKSKTQYIDTEPHGELFVSPRGDFFAFLLPKRSGFTLIHTGSQQKRVIRHHHAITSLDFHPTEPCVGYGDEKGKIRINYCLFASNTRDGKKDNSKHHNQKTSQPQNNRIDKFEWHTTPVSALHFSPDGYHLFSGGLEEVLVIWHVTTRERAFIPRLGAGISSIVFNQQGTVYALCCKDNSIRIINALSKNMTMKIQGISLEMGNLPITIEPRNGLVVTSFRNGSLQFYDPVQDKSVDQMEVIANPQAYLHEKQDIPMATVEHVVFGPKGSFMVTADYRKPSDTNREINIKFWKHDGRQYVLNTVAHQAHQHKVMALACHPILPLVASCSLDCKFKIWEQKGREHAPGSKQMWVCRSVGDYKGKTASALAFSTDGSLLAVAFKSTIALWDPISNTFRRSLTFTNCRDELIKCLAFVPSSHYLVSATANQMFVWDLLRCSVAWSCFLNVKQLAVDTSVSYQANLVFPSPASLVSCFVVTDRQHIYLFSPSSPKPIHVWRMDGCKVMSLAFAATSSVQPEGHIIYLSNESELIRLEKRVEKKTDKNTTAKGKVSLSMTKATVPQQKEEGRPSEKISAFENRFGKLSITSEAQQPENAAAARAEGTVQDEDVGLLVPRPESTPTLFNPSVLPLSQLFNGPSHLLPSPSKIYYSFMEGLFKRAHHAPVASSQDQDAMPVEEDLKGTGQDSSQSLLAIKGPTLSKSNPKQQQDELVDGEQQRKRRRAKGAKTKKQESNGITITTTTL